VLVQLAPRAERRLVVKDRQGQVKPEGARAPDTHERRSERCSRASRRQIRPDGKAFRSGKITAGNHRFTPSRRRRRPAQVEYAPSGREIVAWAEGTAGAPRRGPGARAGAPRARLLGAAALDKAGRARIAP